MVRTSWKSLLIGAVVVLALSAAAPQANAHWWGYYQPVAWGGYYAPYYSSCYSSCYTPCYTTVSCDPCGDSYGWYAGWRPGPVRRLLLGRYKWYWGSTGCGYAGCYSGCIACCGDGAVVGSAPAQATQPTPAPTPAKKPVMPPPMPVEPAAPTEPAPPAPGAQPEPAMPKTSATSAENSGILTVWVPNDAKVTVNGLETRSSGSRRLFVSYGLKPGLSYKYVVRAQIVRNGQVVEDTRNVVLTAGQITAVAFGFNSTPTEGLALAN
jgi:uncharacterized protein (TIGR03000 family)